MNYFFSQVEQNKSFCIFYAKKMPYVESSKRIIIGIGKIQKIIPAKEYNYFEPKEIKSMLWETMVKHFIRTDYKNGFIMPYSEFIELSKENSDFDLIVVAKEKKRSLDLC